MTLVRPSGPVRPVTPAAFGGRLPTVAALLAATATLALAGCRTEALSATADEGAGLTVTRLPAALEPRELDPAQPPAGMGGLEPPPPHQPADPPPVPVVKPPKGKPIAPSPFPHFTAGGRSPIAPPPPPPPPPRIAPIAKPRKLSGDVSSTVPETF